MDAAGVQGLQDCLAASLGSLCSMEKGVVQPRQSRPRNLTEVISV